VGGPREFTSHYDLLASECRLASLVAIAKGDVPITHWSALSRPHIYSQGQDALLSWTGTMFEYLMPMLWMKSYANTLLDRSRIAVVAYQQTYGNRRGVPWGISESAYYKTDEQGNYQYRAFGIPLLALMKEEMNALVISPYSTFLALTVDQEQSLRNLRRLDRLGAFSSHGFYESVDYTNKRMGNLVRCWMAHHQGMSMLSIANFLCDNVVQKWFHSNRRVQATELLLHEKPVSHVQRSNVPRLKAA
jgi:hypothetical protein